MLDPPPSFIGAMRDSTMKFVRVVTVALINNDDETNAVDAYHGRVETLHALTFEAICVVRSGFSICLSTVGTASPKLILHISCDALCSFGAVSLMAEIHRRQDWGTP